MWVHRMETNIPGGEFGLQYAPLFLNKSRTPSECVKCGCEAMIHFNQMLTLEMLLKDHTTVIV